MDCVSTNSVEHLISSSDENSGDIELMARCVERQLAGPIPKPTTGTAMAQKRSGSPRPIQTLFPTFNQRYFNLVRGNGPLTCDSRVTNNHPINFCRNLISQVNTQLSPPIEDRRPDYGSIAPSSSYFTDTVSVEPMSNHFNGMALSETSGLVN